MTKWGLGVIALIFLVSGCAGGGASRTTRDQLEDAKDAAEMAEEKAKELESQRIKLETQITEKEKRLADCLAQLRKG